jgi:hypothetical protein
VESFTAVTCPHCFQTFELAAPPPCELPASLDYDCEICCRPMTIHIDWDALEEEPTAAAISLED